MKAQSFYTTIIALIFFIISATCSAQTPAWEWAKSAGGSANDIGTAITTDSNGNSYITGYFASDSITFGTTTLTGNGYAAFIVKYDSSGDVIWAKSAGSTTGAAWAMSITNDGNNNVYVTGFFTGNLIIGSDTLTSVGNYDIFTAKYANNGNVIWAKSGGGTGDDKVSSIITDTSGNVYITGYFSDPSITFGIYTLPNYGVGGYDIFTVKYDNSGNVIWAKGVGGAGADLGACISTDGNNLYITGPFDSPTITFGTTTLNNAGSDDIYIAKYDNNGNVIWAKSTGGASDDEGLSINTDKLGNSYLTGYFISSTISFGTTTLNNGSGTNHFYIAKYDNNGNALWAKSANGNGALGESVTTSESNNVYVTGYLSAPSLTFDSDTLTSAGAQDIFVVKYDNNGNLGWAKSAGGTDMDFGLCISNNGSDNIYLTGSFASPSITFGATILTNDTAFLTRDIYIAKIETGTLGIAKHHLKNELELYPNPFSVQTVLETKQILKNATLSVYNVFGQKVAAIKNIVGHRAILKRGHLPEGVYLLRLTENHKIMATQKVIIAE